MNMEASPDQSQPGHIVWIRSDELSGYDIGSVQEPDLRVRGQLVALELSV